MVSRARGRGWRRLADLSIRPRQDSFEPYRDDAIYKEFSVEPNVDQDRIVVREWRDERNGALSDFVVTQQAFDHVSQRWVDVVRVDTRHGTVHMHGFGKGGSEVSHKKIRSYSTREEMEDAYRRIYDDVFDAWEDHRRRWASG